jgi:hypothetical protein
MYATTATLTANTATIDPVLARDVFSRPLQACFALDKTAAGTVPAKVFVSGGVFREDMMSVAESGPGNPASVRDMTSVEMSAGTARTGLSARATPLAGSVVVTMPMAEPRASRNSPAVWNRSAGDLARARCTIVSHHSGRSSRCWLSGVGNSAI